VCSIYQKRVIST